MGEGRRGSHYTGWGEGLLIVMLGGMLGCLATTSRWFFMFFRVVLGLDGCWGVSWWK